MSTQAQARLALALLNIQPGEGNLVALLVAQSLCVGVARSLAETASESLFLARFGAQNLPYFYVVMGIAIVLAGLLYARLAQTLAFTRLLVATLVALILSAVALRIALALPDAGWASFAAPVWSEVLA